MNNIHDVRLEYRVALLEARVRELEQLQAKQAKEEVKNSGNFWGTTIAVVLCMLVLVTLRSL